MAINYVSKQIMMGNFEFVDMVPLVSNRMLVLSLGTGIAKYEEKYSAAQASTWGALGWVWQYHNGATPIIDAFTDASSDMVDIHVSTLFQSLHSEKNYLRIQVPTLHFISTIDLNNSEAAHRTAGAFLTNFAQMTGGNTDWGCGIIRCGNNRQFA